MSTAPLVRVVARDRSGPGPRLALDRLAFGLPLASDAVRRPVGRPDLIYHFAPGALFCMVWARRNRLGRLRRVLAVVEAPRTAGGGRELPGVRPGVIVHATLAQHRHAGVAAGSGDVDHMLELVDRARDAGREPAHLPAWYWAEAAERILFGRTPPAPPLAGPADHRRPA